MTLDPTLHRNCLVELSPNIRAYCGTPAAGIRGGEGTSVYETLKNFIMETGEGKVCNKALKD